MSDDSKVNLKSDGQRKQPQGEKPHGIRWLTSSAHGVAQRAKEMLHQGIENSGFSLFAERIKKLEGMQNVCVAGGSCSSILLVQSISSEDYICCVHFTWLEYLQNTI